VRALKNLIHFKRLKRLRGEKNAVFSMVEAVFEGVCATKIVAINYKNSNKKLQK
jgi:hypothetical protein